MVGVVKLFPEATEEPPETVVNQLTVAPGELAAKSTVPVPQRLPGVVLLRVGEVLIVATTAVLVPEPQVPFKASA